MQRVSARAPVEDCDRDRQWQGGAVVEERRARERADDADRERALDLRQLERQRLPRANERKHCKETDVVGAAAPDETRRTGGDADDAHRPDDERETRRKLEEGRPVQRARLRRPALLGGLELLGGWERCNVLSVLDHRKELRAALCSQQQRLRARADDSVAALE